MKLIEFTGVPGSGKTTILPKVKRALVNKGWPVYDVKDIKNNAYKKLTFPFRQIVSILPFRFKWYISKKIIKSNNLLLFYRNQFINKNKVLIQYIENINDKRSITEFEKKCVLEWFFKTGEIYQMAVDVLDRNSYLILDEGFVHKIVNLFVSPGTKSIDKKRIEQYLSLIPKVELLIYMGADISLSIKRGNEIQRLKGKTKGEISNFFKMSSRTISQTVNYCLHRGIKIINIQNNNKFPPNSEEINNLFNNYQQIDS